MREKMSSIVHFHTREKKNRVVGVCLVVCDCVKIKFDSTPKTEIDLLRCFFVYATTGSNS